MNGLLLLKLISSTCVHMCVCKCASLINFPYPLKSNPHSVIDYMCLPIIISSKFHILKLSLKKKKKVYSNLKYYNLIIMLFYIN